MEDNELQKKYMEFQMVQQHMAELQKQGQIIGQQIAELEASKQSLDELKLVKAGTEILVPVHSGIFFKAQLRDTQELKVNVGSNVAVTKSIDETKALLEGQQAELAQYRQQVVAELQEYLVNAKRLEQELTKMVQ